MTYDSLSTSLPTDSPTSLPTIGFIGAGVISSALAEGLCRPGVPPYPLIVSPRNAERAAALAARFPERLRVAAHNQQVVDEADWLFLAVVSRQSEEILRPLRFRPEHKVISLLSDKSLPQLAEWIGPTQTLLKMVPLPYAAQGIGPIVQYPPNAEAQALFAPLGQLITVESAQELRVPEAVTALMAPYYTLLRDIVAWCVAQGLDEQPAQAYTAAFFGALSQLAATGDLAELADEMTPGGLNAMAKKHITEQGGFSCWVEALDPILRRIGG